MKKLNGKLRLVKKKDGKSFEETFERNLRAPSVVCVNAELFCRLHYFLESMEDLFHNKWERTRYELTGIPTAETLLKPENEGYWPAHTIFLERYNELKLQLLKKPRGVIFVDDEDKK